MYFKISLKKDLILGWLYSFRPVRFVGLNKGLGSFFKGGCGCSNYAAPLASPVVSTPTGKHPLMIAPGLQKQLI